MKACLIHPTPSLHCLAPLWVQRRTMNVFYKNKSVRIPSQITILSVWLVWGAHVLCPYVRQGWRTRSILVWCWCIWQLSFTFLSTNPSSFVWREGARNTIIILCFREQNFSVFVCLYRMRMRCNYTSNSVKRMEESRMDSSLKTE